MRELSRKEYEFQKTIGTLNKYKVIIQDENEKILITIPIKANNIVDALHKSWKRKKGK